MCGSRFFGVFVRMYLFTLIISFDLRYIDEEQEAIYIFYLKKSPSAPITDTKQKITINKIIKLYRIYCSFYSGFLWVLNVCSKSLTLLLLCRFEKKIVVSLFLYYSRQESVHPNLPIRKIANKVHIFKMSNRFYEWYLKIITLKINLIILIN